MNIKLIKRVGFALTLLLFNNAFAQQGQSLLWEISGNGLKKKSYLYGTMHVSGRIAFHLGEEFYDALNNADAMALESNPIIWLKEINKSRNADQFLGEYYISYNISGDFYQNAFRLIVPENADYGAALSSEHFLINWLLYRENKSMSDFEEDTFLDMFIYQAGSKNNKPVYSLEDFNETNRITALANLPDEVEEEPADWYVKLTKDKTHRELLQDAYRNQNLSFLDSLQKEVSGANYLKYMLYERNVIMAANIDSLLKTGISLFSGVGAAHLPGEKGMIQLLKDKGYSVVPIKPSITEKAKEEKEKLSKKKRPLNYDQTFECELFKLNLPVPMYETVAYDNARDFFAPELTNGAYYSVSVLSTYSFFSGTSKLDFSAKIDSLLFEYIPGKLISKKKVENRGFKGWDIVNQTKSGDIQRYQIYFTPMHVMLFKMGGKHDWVQMDGDKFFKSIEIKAVDAPWHRVQLTRGDFSVELPSYYSIKSNTNITALYDHPEIQAFDFRDSSYYWVKRGSYQDLGYIEEDEFELNRMLDKFIETLKIDSFEFVRTTKHQNFPSMEAMAYTSEGKSLYLKSIVRGPYYYIMASVNTSELANQRFMNSLQFENFKYHFDTQKQTDSIVRFSVESQYLVPDELSQQIKLARMKMREKNVKNELDKYFNRDQQTSYYSENYEEVNVEVVVFSPYYSVQDLDKFWEKQIQFFNTKKYLYVRNKSFSEKPNMKIMEVTFADSTSSRTIEKKYVLSGKRLYTLTANLDTLSSKSDYIDRFFSSFTPFVDSNNLESVFDDKAALFFSHLTSTDSMTRDAALMALNSGIEFQSKHVQEMIKVIKTYPFGKEYFNAKAELISALGKLNHPEVLPFLTQYYMHQTDTSAYQVAVLNALANQKSKKATKLFIKLLEKDIPVVNDSRSFSSAFRPFYDSLPLATQLYPDLFAYTFVNRSYEEEIYYLASAAVISERLNPKVYKRFTNEMVKKSKIIIKAERSSAQKTKNYSGSNTYLRLYANLLFPYRRKKQVKLLIEDMYKLNNRFRTELIPVMLRNNVKVTQEYIAPLQKDINNYQYLATVIDRLKEKLRDELPKGIIEQERLSRAMLFYGSGFRAYDEAKDSVVFVSKEFVKTRREAGWVYFYKTKRENDDRWTLAYIGIQPENENEFKVDLNETKTNISIPRGALIEDIIQEELKSIQLKDRPRASDELFGGFDFGFW